MRPALRAVSVILGLAALGCLVLAFMAGFPGAWQFLAAFAAATCAAVLFEVGSELLNVLYQIRNRL
jgi:hypothetical protein